MADERRANSETLGSTARVRVSSGWIIHDEILPDGASVTMRFDRDVIVLSVDGREVCTLHNVTFFKTEGLIMNIDNMRLEK